MRQVEDSLAENIKINILGKEYSIRSDVEDDYVSQIGTYLNHKIEEVLKTTKTVATLNVLILAAMDIANDYFRVKNSQEKLTTMVEEKTARLIDYIDSHT